MVARSRTKEGGRATPKLREMPGRGGTVRLGVSGWVAQNQGGREMAGKPSTQYLRRLEKTQPRANHVSGMYINSI